MTNPALRRIGDLAARNPAESLVALLVSAMVVAGFAVPTVIRFRTLSVQEVTELVAPAFMAALFIERVIEVFVSIARGEAARQLRVASESAERRAERPKASDEDRYASTVARKRLASFRSETQNVTLVFGVALGLVLSVLGIRVLEQLVPADMVASAAAWQRSGFRMFDVVVTGGLIGGGADGIHKLASVFTTKFDQLANANRMAERRKEPA